MTIPNTAAFRVGDDLTVTRNGVARLMTIYRIDPPGTQGREPEHGVRIAAKTTGSAAGKQIAFDYHTLELGLLTVSPPATCQAFLDDGSCIHSEHTK